MGMQGALKSAVSAAFAAVGDLKIRVSLVLKDTSDFNFNTGKAVASAPITKSVDAILMKKTKSKGSKDLNTTSSSFLLLQAEDIDDPNQYDKVIINGETWRFVNPVDNNGFTIRARITREAV